MGDPAQSPPAPSYSFRPTERRGLAAAASRGLVSPGLQQRKDWEVGLKLQMYLCGKAHTALGLCLGLGNHLALLATLCGAGTRSSAVQLEQAENNLILLETSSKDCVWEAVA